MLVDDQHDDYHDVIQQCSKMFNLKKKRKNLGEKGNVTKTTTKKKKGDKD